MKTRRSAEAAPRRRSDRSPAKPYVLVSRGPDGRVRAERFKSAAEYRFRLVTAGATARPVSLDALIDLLNA
jgi:hypothetical protein